MDGGAFRGVQGATVLHRPARLYEMTIQGATQGATKCYTGCYILPTFKKTRIGAFTYSIENSEEPR